MNAFLLCLSGARNRWIFHLRLFSVRMDVSVLSQSASNLIVLLGNVLALRERLGVFFVVVFFLHSSVKNKYYTEIAQNPQIAALNSELI